MTQTELQKLVTALAGLAAPKGKKAKGKKKGGREKLTEAEKSAFIAQNDAECVAAFTKAGYKDVQPRVNVLTYGKIKPDGSKTGWLAKGRMVRKGEKAIRVGPFALFHESQTDAIPVEQTVQPNAEAPSTVQ